MLKAKKEVCKSSDCCDKLLNALSYATIPTLLTYLLVWSLGRSFCSHDLVYHFLKVKLNETEEVQVQIEVEGDEGVVESSGLLSHFSCCFHERCLIQAVYVVNFVL
jgi:hypothetical protein